MNNSIILEGYKSNLIITKGYGDNKSSVFNKITSITIEEKMPAIIEVDGYYD